MMSARPGLRPYSLPFSIGLFLFAVYLLSFSGTFHVMDELAVFGAGHNLASHGRADINQLIWTNHWTPTPPGIWGIDGNLYTKKAPGISFISAPLIGLGQALPGLNAVHVGLLTNALVTALTAALLVVWLADLGFSRPVAAWTGLAYGLGTLAWVYARMFWESSLLALAFLLALWSLYRATCLARPRHRWRWLLVCGTAAAVGLSLRFEAALAIAWIGLFLIAWQRGSVPAGAQASGPQRRKTLRLTLYILLFVAPALVVGLGLLYFNAKRFGSLAETGYTQEFLFRQPWVGALGLLLSPGRGLFIYAPLLGLLFFGLRPAWRRLPRLYWALVVTICLCYWLFYGAWFAWGGTWGWGPRFLLPILPLLMLFVAEPLEWLGRREQSRLKTGLLWTGVGLLAALSLAVNLLGIVVDFNQHFLRLGSNDNFVFNWAAFPPLAHWRILQEGLVDLIWLRPGPQGLQVEWPVLLPPLVLLAIASINLIISYQRAKTFANSAHLTDEGTYQPPHRTHIVLRITFYALPLLVSIGLTWAMLTAAARLPLAGQQARSDLAVLDSLAASAQAGDALLVAMPPFGDVQEISTLLLAYLEPALPIYAWIENEPRAIQPDERERLWQAMGEARRVWLFERWLIPAEPTGISAARLNQEAFPLRENWFAGSGRLTLYALADYSQPAPSSVPLYVPFSGGPTLVDFSVWNDTTGVKPGESVKLRLTWETTGLSGVTPQDISGEGISVFAQIVDEATAGRNLAQSDRLLIDLSNLGRSPLQPGQTLRQGYGLPLPPDLAPGSYPLVVGLYYTATGQRLPRADGSPDDFVYLTDVAIK